MRIILLTLLGCLLVACVDPAPASAPTSAKAETEEKIIEIDPATAAQEAKTLRASASVQVDPALALSLWAADSLVTDPIAISIAPDGRVFYTRAERMKNSEFDVRGHMDWTEDIMALQTVEERREFLRKTFAAGAEQSELHLKDLNNDGVKDWQDLTVQQESVWAVSDRNGDGVADRAQQFIADFNDEVTDVANGLTVFEDEVYVNVAPDFWKLSDDDKDGIADRKTSLATGFGVHIGFSGHGMSGATIGPQGRLWWGIGDIGSNVVDQEGKHWKNPNRGVVARCDPDGSNFEIFAHGVRNTHEFAFDDYGNLITVDNDGDHPGERERLVYLIDGSDTGWRINWQYGKYTDPKNNDYKVWMDEAMHLPRNDQQAAYFLPPIQNYVNGPTGLVYNPGTGLGPDWAKHFFVAEFRGGPSNSPIHAFTMEPAGAGFKLGTTKEIVRGLLPTGLDFGPDGALYFGDWINGWGAKGKGKIWKLDVAGADAGAGDAAREEVANLVTSDFTELSPVELKAFLSHTDQRVRRKAQFALANMGRAGARTLQEVATSPGDEMARVHAIWGLAQQVRYGVTDGAVLLPLLTDIRPEIIAQAAKMVGDQRVAGGEAQLIDLLQHRSARVQFFAAEALGRLRHGPAVEAIVQLLRENDDQDIYLRQAGMIALGRIGDGEALAKLSNDPSRSVRIAAVVALRRMASDKVFTFLFDRDDYIVAEAARAIHDDFSIPGAMPKLAEMLDREGALSEVVLRRAISANLRIGEKENVDLLLNFIQREDAAPAMRAEALSALATWGAPSVFDRVTGRFRGHVTRDDAYAAEAYTAVSEALLRGKEEDVRLAALQAAASLGADPATVEEMLREDASPKIKAAALTALSAIGVDNLDELLLLALQDKSSEVRSRALKLLPESAIAAERTVDLYREVIDNGTTNEAQTALAGLGGLETAESTALLSELFAQLKQDDFPEALRLDLVEAITAREDEDLIVAMDAYEEELKTIDSLGYYAYALEGGNKDAGSGIFYWNSSAQCTRCHAVFEYGGNVGPTLEGVGARMNPKEILTSIVYPSAALAPGYETVLVTLKDESVFSGIVRERTAEALTISVGKTETKTFATANIAEVETLPSSMPPIEGRLDRKGVRDLVAWLATLKGHASK